jgi:hypothetical protein
VPIASQTRIKKIIINVTEIHAGEVSVGSKGQNLGLVTTTVY